MQHTLAKCSWITQQINSINIKQSAASDCKKLHHFYSYHGTGADLPHLLLQFSIVSNCHHGCWSLCLLEEIMSAQTLVSKFNQIVTMHLYLNAQTKVSSNHLNCSQPMSICLRLDGKLFHGFGPAASKHQSPKLLQVHLTTQDAKNAVDDDLLQMTADSQVSQSHARQLTVDQVHPLLNRKPVQLMQHQHDYIIPSSTQSETCSSILDGQQPLTIFYQQLSFKLSNHTLK